MKSEFDGLIEYLLGKNILMQEAIELLERRMIAGALVRSQGNQCAASKQLGIHRNTLLRKMVEYDLGNGRGGRRRKPAAREARGRRKKPAA